MRNIELRGFSKVIQAITEWVTRLFSVNILWLLLNIPVLLSAAVLSNAENTQQIFFFVIPFLLICTFTLFPSTIAMFSVVRKWTMNETDIPVFRSFFGYFKENYKQSIIAGIIIEVLWLVLIADYYYFTDHISSSLTLLFIILAVFVLMISLFFLATIVHYQIGMYAAFKNAAIMVITHPVLSFSLGTFNLAVIYISLSIATFLIPFFTAAVISFVTFAGYYKIYLKIEQVKQTSE